MSLEVIGVGFGRTGTVSIKLALERLGFAPCYHMQEVFENPAQLEAWQPAVAGEDVDWDALFDGFRACVDWPAVSFWQDVVDHFADAKVLLNVRPPELWLASFSRTVRELIGARDRVSDPYIASVLEFASEIIESGTFGDRMHDDEHVLAAFEAHSDAVRRHVAAERLLVFDVVDGWEPLCRFLDVPVPDEAFPRTNGYDDFWKVFGWAVGRSDV
ncbi:MAG: sulfotransferase [Woeseiaceae bacterium]|nr:sulfotransferase [Woeseiaceae bacterium]